MKMYLNVHRSTFAELRTFSVEFRPSTEHEINDIIGYYGFAQVPKLDSIVIGPTSEENQVILGT